MVKILRKEPQMLTFDLKSIGNRLFEYRKKKGLTQIEVAELAGISDRTYADIERGNVNMRIETLNLICQVLDITPNDVLTEKTEIEDTKTITELIQALTPLQANTAFKLVKVYIDSLN